MPQARGTDTTIAIYEETTYGTDPATPAGQKVYFQSCALQAQQNLLDSNTISGSRERSRPARGNINAAGNLSLEIGAENIGTLLKHALGGNSTTGAGPYVHTLTLGDLPVGLVVEKDFGSDISGTGRYHKFNGVRINGARFGFPQEGYCTAEFDLVGASETLGSATIDAGGGLDAHGHTPFTAFAASIEEGGSSIATVTACEINLDNGLDQSVYTIGGAGVRAALPEGFATVTGSITALFDSAALLAKAANGTQSSLKITLSRGDGLGSAGNESVEFFVQQLEFERSSPAIDGPGGILVTLPYKAYIDGSTSALQVTLKNAVGTI